MEDPLLSENKTKDYKKKNTGEYGIIGLDEVGFQNTTQKSKPIKEMQDSLSETETKENKNIDEYRIMDSEEISYGNTTQNSEIMKQPEDSLASENRTKENKKTKTDKYVTLALEKMWYENETENNEVVNQIQTSLLNGIKEKNTDGYVILNLEKIGFENAMQNSEVGKERRDSLFSENITKENKANAGEYGIMYSEVGFQNTTQRSKTIKEIQDSLSENGTKENKNTDAYRILDLEEISYGNPTRNSNIKQIEDLVRKTENGTEENKKITDKYITLYLKKKLYKDEAGNKALKQMQVSLLNGNKEVRETNTHEYVTDSEKVAFVNTTQGIEIIKQTQDLSLSENGTKESKETNRIEIKISDPLMTENERQEYTETNMDKYLLEFETNEYEETTENKITRTEDLISSGNKIQEQMETNTNGYVTNRSTNEEYQGNEINEIASKPEKFFIGKVIQEHKYLINGAKEEKYGVENKSITETLTSFLNENNQKQMKKVYGHNVLNILSEDSKETLKTTDSVTSIVDRLPNGMYEQEKGKYLINRDSRGKVTEDKEVVSETVHLALNEKESTALSTTNKFETQINRKYNRIKEIRLPDNNERFSFETDYSIVREDAEETEMKGVTSYNRETEHYDKMELKKQTYLEAVTNEKLPKEIEKATLRDEETSVSTEELENAEQVTQSTTERERNAESPKGKYKTMWNLSDSYNKEEPSSVQTTSNPDAAYENEPYKIVNETAKIQLNEIEKPSVKETGVNRKLDETSLHNKENLTENTSNIYPREETEDKIANKMVNEISVTGKQGKKTGGKLELQTPKTTKEESSRYISRQAHRKTLEEEISEVNLPSEKAVKTLAGIEKKYAKEKTWKEEDGAKNINKHRDCNRDERTLRTLLKVCMIKSYLFFLGSRSFISEEMVTSDVCTFNKQWCGNVVISTVEKCIQAFFCDFFNCNVLYCPFVLKIRVCPSLLKFGDKCSNDEECPYRQLCCYNGCYRACREGVENHPFYY
ncbi:uncharacterized protein LOC143249006 [Tachypleus tridentatus]|uniref:uncharacterized protein LOC143249006 n=1 Tax=Tachypleus tridentatus TaxID=6853 RepID=UPI003FD2248A